MQRCTRWLAACALLALSSCAQVPATQPPPAPALPTRGSAPPPPTAPVVQAEAPAAGAQAATVPPPGAAAQPAPLPPPKPPTIALILPAQTTPFARAAETVRQGFFAAQSVSGTNATIQLVELEEGPAQLAAALKNARDRGADIAVGPLTRDAVNALGSGRVAAPLPVVTLNLPETDIGLAPHVLAFGVSIELEARQIVAIALRELPLPVGAPPAAPRFMVVVGESPLARRMGNAFRDALREAGQAATLYPMRVSYDALQALSDAIAAARLEAVFLALDARDAAAVRPRLPPALRLYATSQVNLGGAEAALLAPELEGVNFVDMPWLLEPDHLAVVVHPKPEQALSGELQRLYALGIDAFRLAIEWVRGRRSFGLDGVTGALGVDRDRSARVERVPSLAVFRSGKVERRGLAR